VRPISSGSVRNRFRGIQMLAGFERMAPCPPLGQCAAEGLLQRRARQSNRGSDRQEPDGVALRVQCLAWKAACFATAPLARGEPPEREGGWPMTRLEATSGGEARALCAPACC
jgi:hypothetical protein